MQLFLLYIGVWKWTFRKYCPHFFLYNFGIIAFMSNFLGSDLYNRHHATQNTTGKA